MLMDGELEGLAEKKMEMNKLLDKLKEKASSILELSLKCEEIEKQLTSERDLLKEVAMEVELKEKSAREKITELEKKEERLREVEKKVELLSNSNDEKSNELEKTMKEFDLKQKEWIEKKKKEEEIMEASLKKNVEKENELRSLVAVIKDIEAKQKAKAEEIELKEKKLEEREKELDLKQKELEERSTQAETRKRSMKKWSEADSHARLTERHQPFGEAHEESGSNHGIGEYLPIPDSEFSDFEKTMSSFVVGQVWAVYHDVDQMPRYYGLIKNVDKSQLSLKVTWLETQNEEPDVPVACGRFKYGRTEAISHLMFSHEMHPIKRGRNFIDMYPKKGETWAIFRDWTKSWNSNPKQHKGPYKYDFVEVELDDFVKDKGIGVAYLGKVEGFVSIFQHAGKDGVLQFMITPDEMNRFSHKVPSFKMNGDEKEGVPPGSFELDPAAIPSSVLKCKNLEDKEEETEREIQDCGKSGDVKDQDEVLKETPIVVSD